MTAQSKRKTVMKLEQNNCIFKYAHASVTGNDRSTYSPVSKQQCVVPRQRLACILVSLFSLFVLKFTKAEQVQALSLFFNSHYFHDHINATLTGICSHSKQFSVTA